MKRILASLGVLLALSVAAVAQSGSNKTAAQLNTEINTLFSDNNIQSITPAYLRQVTLDMVASAPPLTLLSGYIFLGNGSNVATGYALGTNVATALGVNVGSAGAFLTGNQTVTLSGDVTGSGTTAITTALGNIPSGATMAGSILATNIAAPGTPASGKTSIFSDSTNKRFHDINDVGTIGTTVVADTGATSNYIRAISAAGVITKSRPTCSTLSDSSTGCTTTVGTIATQNASSVAITGGTLAGITGFGIRDTSAAFDVTLAAASSTTLTAGRALTFDLGNVAHTLKFNTTANTITFPNTASYTLIGSGDTGTVTGTMIATNTVANSNLAQAGAATIKMNATAGTANLNDSTIQGLTNLASPSATLDYIPVYDHVSGTIKAVTPGAIASSSVAGVGSLNVLTGSLTLASNGGGKVTSSGTAITYGDPGGYINKFRNGTFDVWARGTSALTAYTTLAIPCVATADGWCVKQTGAAFTCARDTGAYGTLYSLRCVGGTSNTDTIIAQRIESYIAAPLAGSTVTVQYQYKQDTGGNITPKISTCYASAQDNFTTCTTDLASTSLTSCATATWCTESYTFTASANASNGYEIDFDCNTALTNAQHCWITAADIRVTPSVSTGVNVNPPPPELRPVAAEAAYCARYLNYWTGPQYSRFVIGYADSAIDVQVVSQGLLLRSIPTITLTNMTAGGSAASAPGAVNYSAGVLSWYFATSAQIVSTPIQVYVAAGQTGTVVLSSEL